MKQCRRRVKEEASPEVHAAAVKYGKPFMVTRALWCPTEAFAPTKPDEPSSPHEQFLTEGSYIQAMAFSLYEHLPPDKHWLVAETAFRAHVRPDNLAVCLHASPDHSSSTVYQRT